MVLFEDMKDAGYEGTMISGRKVFSKAENYLFGNIKTMKTVIVIPLIHLSTVFGEEFLTIL